MKRHLLDQLKGCRTIATVGTCKNAGKTTVLNFLIEGYHNKKILGITSIGYDGEATDAVTQLPKPRIQVYPRMMVATSRACLDKATAMYKEVTNTGLHTSLGEVVIVEIVLAGIMEIAGPAMTSQIMTLTEQMKSLGCTKILVDGAAGRLSYGCYTDGAILSVGAAMSNDLSKLVREAKHQIRLMSLKAYEGPILKKVDMKKVYDVLTDDQKHIIRFRGTVVDQDIRDISQQYHDKPIVLVAKDPSVLFISPRETHYFFEAGNSIELEHEMNLLAVTINPMTPYGSWMNPIEMEDAMSKDLATPVYNIKNEKVNRYEE